MDKQRFLDITDTLSRWGYNFFKEQIYHGKSGHIIEAIHENDQLQYYLVVPTEDFSFEALSAIQKTSGSTLYALERYFICYSNTGQKVTEVDQLVCDSVQKASKLLPSFNSSKRILWSTDIHLNFLDKPEIEKFIVDVKQKNPDIYLISGDIGESHDFVAHLLQIEQALSCPVYFVLGNHDFYRGSIRQVRSMAKAISNKPNKLYWLNDVGVVELNKEMALIGHDGWGDGRFGAAIDSEFMLNDFLLIQDFCGLEKKALFGQLNHQGDLAAKYLKTTLLQALKNYSYILLLTHVPPFAEASFHIGRISDDQGLPHFACKAVGEVLLEVMKEHPKHKLMVLCGHTHSAGVAHILENLIVLTGNARYCDPKVQNIFMI